MSSSRLYFLAARPVLQSIRPFSSALPRFVEQKDREHSNQQAYRDAQTSKPPPPHMTNSNSTIANKMPSVGADSVPPELISSVDPNFTPKDSIPENTERMMGGEQPVEPASSSHSTTGQPGEDGEMGIGEMEGAQFKVEPLRRTGEDANTMRARLQCTYLRAAFCSLISTFLLTSRAQINRANAARSNLICCSQPSPTRNFRT